MVRVARWDLIDYAARTAMLTTLMLLSLLAIPCMAVVQSLSEQRAASLRREWASQTSFTWLLATCLAGITVATCAAIFVQEAPLPLDDAFITFRYARNLALGHGLVWNPGEVSSEGYTNLLLVLLAAPVIRFGGDPLLATRILSGLAALALVALVARMARRDHGSAQPVALVGALSVLTSSVTAELVMLGLETVLFAACNFVAFALAERYLSTEEPRWLKACGLTAFVALLLRPEAVFLPVAVAGSLLVHEWRQPKQLARKLAPLLLSFGIPLVIYLGWKLSYYGSIVPNPALVKMSAPGFVRPRGVQSVRNFLTTHWKVVVFALVSIASARKLDRARLTAAIVLAIYLIFYLRVDTLMDVHQRFLFPAFPFLLVLALPVLLAMVAGFRELPGVRVLQLPLGVLLFLLVFYNDPWLALFRVAQRGQIEAGEGGYTSEVNTVLTRIGAELGRYDGIEGVTIGNTDAGIIPYLSRARHVDMAGLVTRFIATHDTAASADYFFAQKPDLIIARSELDGSLITYEHGVLGDYTRWANHAGWNDYAELGGVHAGPRFDLHFYLRRKSSHEASLGVIIRGRLAQPDVRPVTTHTGT